MLKKAISVFRSIPNIQLGFKIPGIHWRIASGGDRLAELNAGLISTSSKISEDSSGHGHAQIIGIVPSLKRETGFQNLNLHFTCLEMDNYENGDYANSLAKVLVFWVGAEAKRQEVRILGENALAGTLYHQKAWSNIENALVYSFYDGIALLRMTDILSSDLGKRSFTGLVKKFNSP